MIRAIERKIWLWQFILEEKRQDYAALRQLWREAFCCVVLIVLGGGR